MIETMEALRAKRKASLIVTLGRLCEGRRRYARVRKSKWASRHLRLGRDHLMSSFLDTRPNVSDS